VFVLESDVKSKIEFKDLTELVEKYSGFILDVIENISKQIFKEE
jgi:hypothetical protein